MHLNHGGDIYSTPLAKGMQLLDFSANINPLGLPRGVIRAVKREAGNFDRYPDPLCRKLRAALAEYYRIDPDRIVCGNGAADLIYRIVQWKNPRKALLTAPIFSEYEKALSEKGCVFDQYPLSYPRFEIDEDILLRITGETGVVFLCNPNNPTGVLIRQDVLENVIRKCNETKTVLVIDECFNEFLDDPPAHSARNFLDGAPNLIILKAFTKTYAMAGLRLGYALCGSPEIANALAEIGQAWAVSQPAQAGGIAALKEEVYLERSRDLVIRERKYLKTALSNLGLEVLGGEANYIFFRIKDGSGFSKKTFSQALLDRGILVRSCASYSGLDDSYFRIAVRLPKEDKILIRALQGMKNKIL
ncbi:threonine-phosphate decarboxylase CobD [Treponema primitia]|uniref:threonine-phosphate decarboxylase CobD n=1 Tax=Treponema primitia TaxID=88058 RepID=UPI0002554DAE|nr:threonine-phosphate decarboxylase CobD [Treponema primitia]